MVSTVQRHSHKQNSSFRLFITQVTVNNTRGRTHFLMLIAPSSSILFFTTLIKSDLGVSSSPLCHGFSSTTVSLSTFRALN